ncbi:hypothetical protein D9756_006498 [Leucocoprinus leucothites]|uniref:Uncharacterized protein n=1 Tax=Leucocoprinus leucothites TaxID=201217 RepID=A0A8H5LHF9_9AGAR|nr:hypothetical protein D9756_006498 [Leucoagaricus leucothites]
MENDTAFAQLFLTNAGKPPERLYLDFHRYPDIKGASNKTLAMQALNLPSPSSPVEKNLLTVAQVLSSNLSPSHQVLSISGVTGLGIDKCHSKTPFLICTSICQPPDCFEQ